MKPFTSVFAVLYALFLAIGLVTVLVTVLGDLFKHDVDVDGLPPFGSESSKNIVSWSSKQWDHPNYAVLLPLHPIDIELRIVPWDVVQRICADGGTPTGRTIYACSFPGRRPCVIYIPDSRSIFFAPSAPSATWEKDPHGDLEDDLFAHEIGHCLYGSWHKPVR